MSYPNEMTKSALDTLIKSYADSISSFKKQDNIKPLDLRLPGVGQSLVQGALILFGAPLPTQLEDRKYISERTVITSNGIFDGGFDTKVAGTSPSDPIRHALGCFWVMDPVIGPTYARLQPFHPEQQLYFDEERFQSADLNKIIKSYSYKSTYEPGVIYRTIPEYFRNGVEHIDFTPPTMMGPEKSFSFKAPLLNVGYQQFLKIHYNYSKAAVLANEQSTDTLVDPEAMKKTLPLTIFSGLELKNEGVKALIKSEKMPELGYVETTVFFKPTQSETKWDAVFPFLQNLNTGDTPQLAEDNIQEVVNKVLSESLGQKSQDVYEDHSFSSKAAMSYEVQKMFGDELTQNDSFADIKPVYNFTSPFWEKATNSFQLFPEAAKYDVNSVSVNNELAIGNIYTYCHVKNHDEKLKFEFNKYGNKLLYCGLDVDKNEALKYSNLTFFDGISSFSKKVEDVKSQFPMYTEISFESEPLGELGTIMKESGILLEFMETILSYLFTSNQPFAAMTEAEINAYFTKIEELESVGILNTATYSSFEPFLTNIRSTASKIKKPAVLVNDAPQETYDLTSDAIPDYNFLRWLETYVQYLDDPNQNWNPSKSAGYIQRYTKSFGTRAGGISDFSPSKIFSLAKFMPKFQEFVSLKTRGLHDIFSAATNPNKLAHSETIMYRISKFDQSSKEKLQDIFITPDQLTDSIKYIDTQVKYGRNYKYAISALKIVIGTEYQYNAIAPPGTTALSALEFVASLAKVPGDTQEVYGNPVNTPIPGGTVLTNELETEFIGTGGGTIIPTFNRLNVTSAGTQEAIGLSVVEVKYRPTVRVIEIPYYSEQQVAIIDDPPMPPLVNMYPLSGQKNKLLMTFENQTGARDLVPIPIEGDADAKLFSAIRYFQQRYTKLPNGKFYDPTIRFKSDDSALAYEVYKITGKKPSGYNSFSKSKVATLQMEKLEAGFEDIIATNTKYYYTFRTIDRHGNPSNPSPVYEVEMVEDSGVTYPIINTLQDFETPEDGVGSKPFRRYLMIDAADQQIFLNEDKTGIQDNESALTKNNPVLGTAEKSLWNDKTFKFRIKSKETGRVIDLNVAFKTKHIVDGNESTNLCD